jgi:hypothetical protein
MWITSLRQITGTIKAQGPADGKQPAISLDCFDFRRLRPPDRKLCGAIWG